jgi:CHAT domain-containing protein
MGIVHFAGHALASPDDPAYSALLLDSGAGLVAPLYAEAIERLKLRARVVVLAACDTASGPAASEGAMSLSRAFLAAGADAVVASLWPADDRQASRLSVELHRRLRAGRPVEDALREAQLEAMRGVGSRAADWAGFALLAARAGIQAPGASNVSKGDTQ